MSKDEGYKDYILHDVMKDIPGITVKNMFGGYCFYKEGKVFGMIANSVLYFKVGDSNRKDYEKAHSKPFIYESKGKSYKMSYWDVPEEVLNDNKKLNQWIENSLSITPTKK